jgi:hypothetical protein
MTKRGAVGAKTAVLKRRTFTREFNLQVIRGLLAPGSQEIHRSIASTFRWREGLPGTLSSASSPMAHPSKARARGIVTHDTCF